MTATEQNIPGAFDVQESLQKLADQLAAATFEVRQRAATEEDLRIGFEKLLEPVLTSIGVKAAPRYERLSAGARSIYRGRPDAVHGRLIIEYEPPGAFSSPSAVLHAQGQLVDYLLAEAQTQKADLQNLLTRWVGVGFDGEAIFFVHHQPGKPGVKASLQKEAFVRRGPYPFDLERPRTLLTYLRALARLPLNAENLAEKFGPKSKLAPLAVSAFLDAILHWGGQRVKIFFHEWQRLFGIVYGEQFSTPLAKEKAQLATVYGLGAETAFQPLLFAVHTYFALFMKLIAVELLYLQDSSFSVSFSHRITHAPREPFRKQLADIEEGGIFAKRGLTNFLEGDFFRWYLHAFSPRLEDALREVARALAEFEPATTAIDPEATRDLLKKLYQYLVPREVRHKLGEYYTPDWLAEFILNEVGYQGNTLKRLLDPACGSGTFLVLAIQRARQYGRRHQEPPLETAKRITTNIWGFDLNPLAVIASRTNYLFALGPLAQELPALEIPVYLADAVLWPQKKGQKKLNFVGGEYMAIETSFKTFNVPYIWTREEGFLLRHAAPLIETMTKLGYSTPEAMERLRTEGLVFPPHEQVVENFYNEIFLAEKENKNGIWARFLKNVSAPVMAGKFDFVVGNPPWIRWGYLSQEYKSATMAMWREYGLFSLKGAAARLGGGEKDFSMLFTYAAIDFYLKADGKLGFLITQEVFKSKGAGEGFRRFRLGHREPLQVLRAHDLVSVQPFEKAANKTAAIILRKAQETRYPVPYTLWTRKKGLGKIPTDLSWREAKKLLEKTTLWAKPIGSLTGSWQTIANSQKELAKIEGVNAYKAYRGVGAEPYGVFWLSIEAVRSDGLLIVSNLPEKGKTKISKIEEVIEPDLVYPALRGGDIQRWSAITQIFVLLTQDPKTREPIPEAVMKQRWPRTSGYLVRFQRAFEAQASKAVKSLAARTAFYAVLGVGEYTLANYKVVWQRLASDIIAAVVSQAKTPFGYKSVISTGTTSFFATNNEDEAHFLCAIINSRPVREFIRSYSSAGRGFGAPSVMNHVGIPKFDPHNEVHQNLAQLSKALHDLRRHNLMEKLTELETDVDHQVNTLFGIKK